jgi:hypothetical protein
MPGLPANPSLQRVGNMALLYKRHPKKPKIELPK